MTSSGHAYLRRSAYEAMPWSRVIRTPYRRSFWGVLSVCGIYRPGESLWKFELIPAVKMETRHPVEGYFRSKIPAICNRFGVMAAWSRKTLEFLRKFNVFLKKRPLTGKFSKFCSERIHHVQILWNLAHQKLVKSCVTYQIKNNISPGSPALITAHIAPKVCQVQPPSNVLRVLQISSKSVYFWRSYGRKRDHRRNAL